MLKWQQKAILYLPFVVSKMVLKICCLPATLERSEAGGERKISTIFHLFAVVD